MKLSIANSILFLVALAVSSTAALAREETVDVQVTASGATYGVQHDRKLKTGKATSAPVEKVTEAPVPKMTKAPKATEAPVTKMTKSPKATEGPAKMTKSPKAEAPEAKVKVTKSPKATAKSPKTSKSPKAKTPKTTKAPKNGATVKPKPATLAPKPATLAPKTVANTEATSTAELSMSFVLTDSSDKDELLDAVEKFVVEAFGVTDPSSIEITLVEAKRRKLAETIQVIVSFPTSESVEDVQNIVNTKLEDAVKKAVPTITVNPVKVKVESKTTTLESSTKAPGSSTKAPGSSKAPADRRA
ncbi:predicted protein [Chaetoceros tenuissimus]|uniref:Uncharacterized protein n=1 Tax=Chaetoceros tenuissimus TaxID=426638 RepID=A0AAD3CJ48_9STRA|nr:predicted protein [Chaetoceros tenuissimus]